MTLECTDYRNNMVSQANPKYPVQYINVDFLKRHLKTDDLLSIYHLNLSFKVLAPYRIKYIENFQSLKNLVSLNLSGNAIERIDDLKHLRSLKNIDLSENNVSRLEGLGYMSNLQTLIINDNKIQEIPSWFQNKLTSLKVLDIRNNKIESLHQLTKLRQLLNLTDLSLSGNPVLSAKQLQHVLSPENGNSDLEEQDLIYQRCCRAFVVFHLRTLTVLDGFIVTPSERSESDTWFGQVEISRMTGQLESREAEVVDLNEAIHRLTEESEGRGIMAETLAKENANQDDQLTAMQKELAAKDELLQAKSKELLRACLKHYEIEQELAFYKIDSKFAGLLGKPPETEGYDDVVDHSSIRNTKDSPYLGKCRFIRVKPQNQRGRLGRIGSTQRPHSAILSVEEGTEFEQAANYCSPIIDARRTMSMELSKCSRPTTLNLRSSQPSMWEFSESFSSADLARSSAEGIATSRAHELLTNHRRRSYLSASVGQSQSPILHLGSVPIKRNSPAGVTMPYYGDSPDVDVFATQYCLHSGSPTEHEDDRDVVWRNATDTSSNPKSPRSLQSLGTEEARSRSVRILDSGIETSNPTAQNSGLLQNLQHELSLDDGQLESLSSSKNRNLYSQFRGSSSSKLDEGESRLLTDAQNSISDQVKKEVEKKNTKHSSSCQTSSPAQELSHYWHDETKKRLDSKRHDRKQLHSEMLRVNNVKSALQENPRVERTSTSKQTYLSELVSMQQQLHRLQATIKNSRSTPLSDSTQSFSEDVKFGSDHVACLVTSEEYQSASTSASYSHDDLGGSQLEAMSDPNDIGRGQRQHGRNTKSSFHASWDESSYNDDAGQSLLQTTESCASDEYKKSTGDGCMKPRLLRVSSSTNDVRRRRSFRGAPGPSPSSMKPKKRHGAHHRGKSMDALAVKTKFPHQKEGGQTPLDVRLLFTLQDELCDLHKRLKLTESANSARLQEALRQISLLDTELRSEKVRHAEPGKNIATKSWETKLSAGLEEVQHCQENILKLQQKLSEKERKRKHSNSSYTENPQADDLSEMKKSLLAQERELAKLNEMVNRLLAISPASANVGDLAHVTHGLSSLQQSLEANRNVQVRVPIRQQTLSGNEVTEIARVMVPGEFCCNVSEHHNLEDYVQELQASSQHFQQQLLTQKIKLKETKASVVELESHMQKREVELARVNAELLNSKEELTRANHQVKSILEERSISRKLADESLELRKNELKILEEKTNNLSRQFDQLKSEVNNLENRRIDKLKELAELTRSADEKRSVHREVDNNLSESSKMLTELQMDMSSMENKRLERMHSFSQTELHLIEKRSEFDRMQAMVAESKSHVESLSREIGVKTAELELLNTKKAQDLELAESQMQVTHNKLKTEEQELVKFQELLKAKREEHRCLSIKVNSFNQILSSNNLTSDGISPISESSVSNAADLKRKHDALKADIVQKTGVLKDIQIKTETKMKELKKLKSAVEEECEGLNVVKSKRQNQEAVLMITRQKYDFLRTQLEGLESNVEVKQKLLSDLCISSESRVSALSSELDRLVCSLQRYTKERSTAKSELNRIRSEVQSQTSDLQTLKDRITAAESQLKRTETSLTEQQQRRDYLTNEANILTQSIEVSRLSSRSFEEGQKSTEEELKRLVDKCAKAKDKLSVTNEKLSQQRTAAKSLEELVNNKQNELRELEIRLQNRHEDMNNFDVLHERFAEFEMLLKERENQIAQLTNEKSEASVAANELQQARAQVLAAHRLCKKLKRRTSKELYQLEQVAEEQCNRASSLSQELAVLRKNYTYLQARISTYGTLMDEVFTAAADEEVSGREHRLQEALAAVQAELRGNRGSEAALRHFEVVQDMISRRALSPFSRTTTPTPTTLKTFASVPHLASPLEIAANSAVFFQNPPPPTQSSNFTKSPLSKLPPRDPLTLQKRRGLDEGQVIHSFSPSSGLASSLAPSVSTSHDEPMIGRLPETTNQQLTEQRLQIDMEWERSQSAYQDIRQEMQRIRNQIDGSVD